jgi:hypothetical protein
MSQKARIRASQLAEVAGAIAAVTLPEARSSLRVTDSWRICRNQLSRQRWKEPDSASTTSIGMNAFSGSSQFTSNSMSWSDKIASKRQAILSRVLRKLFSVEILIGESRVVRGWEFY